MTKPLRLMGKVNSYRNPLLLAGQTLTTLLESYQGVDVSLIATLTPYQSGTCLRLEGEVELTGTTVLIGGIDAGEALCEYHGLALRVTVQPLGPSSTHDPAYDPIAFAIWVRQCLLQPSTPARMLQNCPMSLRKKAGVAVK